MVLVSNIDENRLVSDLLVQALALRTKHTPTDQRPKIDLPPKLDFQIKHGLINVTDKDDPTGTPVIPVPLLDDFYNDMEALFEIRTEGVVVSYAYSRLTMMKSKYDIHITVNHELELQEQKLTAHMDFYNVRKVDTHIHHSASMNAKHMLRFMKKKVKTYPNDVVLKENGKDVTLSELFGRLNIDVSELSLDKLQMWADRTSLHRFDRFNNLYSPMGLSLLRTVFLKTDNDMGGRYLAEITRELLDDMDQTKYTLTEWRLSIYGRKKDEWDSLAAWVLGKKSGGPRLLSDKNRWMIQIPRLYNVFKAAGQVNNFQEMLANIFTPLFEVTLGIGEHDDLREFLEHVSGFDTVDDESKSKSPVDRHFSSRERFPDSWDLADNPSYKYYSFYIQSNIRILNQLRASRGLSQFQYRPHCGEAGEIHHLDSSFLLADNIQHGINLRKSPALQYLYYLGQVGLSVSPISNNQLFIPIGKNPFPSFFAIGMLVTLSSDDPLMFHLTKEPLMEEYSVAKQLWRLGSVDMCEIAQNSVLISGFPREEKAKWLGTVDEGGDVNLSNVPPTRRRFRQEVFREEWEFLKRDRTTRVRTSSTSPKGSASHIQAIPDENISNDSPDQLSTSGSEDSQGYNKELTRASSTNRVPQGRDNQDSNSRGRSRIRENLRLSSPQANLRATHNPQPENINQSPSASHRRRSYEPIGQSRPKSMGHLNISSNLENNIHDIETNVEDDYDSPPLSPAVTWADEHGRPHTAESNIIIPWLLVGFLSGLLLAKHL